MEGTLWTDVWRYQQVWYIPPLLIVLNDMSDVIRERDGRMNKGGSLGLDYERLKIMYSCFLVDPGDIRKQGMWHVRYVWESWIGYRWVNPF